MTDETLTLAIGQPEAATEGGATTEANEGPIDLDAAPSEPSAENVASQTQEGDAPPAEDEPTVDDPFSGYEDFEFDGKAYKIPSALKDGYLRQADYTRKTQETAAQAKALQVREAELQRQQQVSEEEFDARYALRAVEHELESFKDVNWMELQSINPEEDPVGAMQAQQKWARYQQLTGIKDRAGQFLQQAAQQRTQAAEQETANRLRATAEFAEREIKGWTPEIDQKVTQFAVKTLGYDVDTLKSAYNPQVYRTLYLAWVGHQSQTRQQAAKPATTPVAATQTVSAKGNAVVQKDPEEMTMSEYAAYRQAQSGRK